MSVGISLEELLTWSQDSSIFWNGHLDANPHLLELPCDIGGTANVQEFVRHIWSVELRWNERLAGLPVTAREDLPSGPLAALFDLHNQAAGIFRRLLAAPVESWEQPYILDMDWVPPEMRTVTRRKIAVHALFHSQRHWAQLATLVRTAGFPSGFKGDLLFSQALC
jgi:uncharacterized damage-inducible protein DinB